jgi:hypothetical protein
VRRKEKFLQPPDTIVEQPNGNEIEKKGIGLKKNVHKFISKHSAHNSRLAATAAGCHAKYAPFLLFEIKISFMCVIASTSLFMLLFLITPMMNTREKCCIETT